MVPNVGERCPRLGATQPPHCSLQVSRRRLSGWGTAMGRSSVDSISVKMAVLAPMPRASESTATAVNPGALRILRRAKAASLKESSTKGISQVPRAIVTERVYTGARASGRGYCELLHLQRKRLAQIAERCCGAV